MELNERIVQLRKQAGLTQEQLGEMLGVSRQAVSKWESGQANPDVVYITEMCRRFDVSTDWLLLGKEDAAMPALQFCPKCGASVTNDSVYCHKCGANLVQAMSGNAACEDDYFLFLTGNGEFSWSVAGLVSKLFRQPWARPAFPWDGSAIDQDKAWDIIQATPMILCRGLTWEQASEGKALFQNDSHLVEVYRERDMSPDFFETLRPSVPPCPTPVVTQIQSNQSLGGGTIFVLVVLGVIAAVLIMSIF